MGFFFLCIYEIDSKYVIPDVLTLHHVLCQTILYFVPSPGLSAGTHRARIPCRALLTRLWKEAETMNYCMYRQFADLLGSLQWVHAGLSRSPLSEVLKPLWSVFAMCAV